MEVQQILHMNEEEGEFSYYRNSLYQKQVILMSKPILEEAVENLCGESSPDCFKMVDMGCSSGPNALLPLWEIIGTIDSTCCRFKKKAPALQFFLNDLPGNDFNTVFRSLLPMFYEKLGKEKLNSFGHCYIAAMPGNFYGRLFPDNSLHFVHSSYSLHYISQVPKGLVSDSGMQLNKGNICLATKSPPSVHKAYLEQFERDFTSFLRCRSMEIISGGRMVLTFLGGNDQNTSSLYGSELFQLIGISLKDMVEERKIEESLLDSFNMPVYCPSAKTVRNLIIREGSFDITRFESFGIDWDANIEDGDRSLMFDRWARGRYVTKYMRAISESMLASHFGVTIIDELFERYSLKIADCLEKGMRTNHNLVMSMAKK